MYSSIEWEIFYTGAAFLLLALYHLHWIYLICKKPLTTSVSITNHLRGHWVEHILQEKLDILAVQTRVAFP